MPIIKFENVTKVYPKDSTVLQDVSLEIQEGEFVSIVGKSGAGKTTLIRLILGLEHPSEGAVYFKGVNVKEITTQSLQELRRGIGAVYQDYRLLPNKTVYENVAYIMQVEGKTDQEIEEEVPKVLEVIGLKDKISNFPHELSGGEQQRLAIARAIVNHPEVLIADEPTGNLDPYNAYEVMLILQKINQAGRTVLLSTHDQAIVNKLGQRVITLEDGRVIRDEAKGKFII
jgi:cell division transport system ATP-binding protein